MAKTKDIQKLKKDIEIMENVALDLFGKQQCRWRHTKLTKEFNKILEINSKKLMERVDELREYIENGK